MPKPVSPVVPGAKLPEVVYAKDQPAYQPLPAYRAEDGTVLTRWKLSWRERLAVLFTGNLYIWLLTFNQPLQPIQIQVEQPEVQ
jgi:hypothetical protein